MLHTPEAAIFAAEAVAAAVAAGVVGIWPAVVAALGLKPYCVLSVFVHYNSAGKPRFILDGRPVNLWNEYHKFSFEGLVELVFHVQRGGYIVYIHVYIHIYIYTYTYMYTSRRPT